ncbi:MAG TPA: SDR family oxidoreductase [Chitinophagaceae bacterium]|nr:SDR family oxidoreductase [Chitinophagaceae bacterium]
MAEKNDKGYALITGATSGIGYELCKLFAADGYNVVLVARSEERLQKVAKEVADKHNVVVFPLAKDLFKKDAAKEIYDELKQSNIRVTALVNDAGQGEYGFFTQTDLDREIDIIQLNIISVVSLTKYFLKDMVAENDGKILNVASFVADYPSPLLAVYAASKAFVLSFTEALVNELKDTNITVTALQPGVTDTDFFYKAGEDKTMHYQEMDLSHPAKVAADGYRALMKGKDKVVSGTKNRIQSLMSNLMPEKKLAESMRKQNAPADDIKRKESGHEASRKEREMIQSSSNTYRGRDLASDSDNRQPVSEGPKII